MKPVPHFQNHNARMAQARLHAEVLRAFPTALDLIKRHTMIMTDIVEQYVPQSDIKKDADALIVESVAFMDIFRKK